MTKRESQKSTPGSEADVHLAWVRRDIGGGGERNMGDSDRDGDVCCSGWESLDWLEAKRLEDGKTVEIWVLMKGGGRKNNIKKEKKERNSWNSGSSLEEYDIGRREDCGRMREMSRSGNGRIIPCSSKGN